jgi:hypothetical protein
MIFFQRPYTDYQIEKHAYLITRGISMFLTHTCFQTRLSFYYTSILTYTLYIISLQYKNTPFRPLTALIHTVKDIACNHGYFQT